MSGDTAIEWTDATWNPTTGCDKVSPGCDNCYAMTLAPRLKGMGSKAYQLDGDPRTSGPGFLAHEWPNALDWPLHKKKPLRIFVNSMSDLFHANISDEYIAQVFAVMAAAPQHTFQILTKRHARMRSWASEFQPDPLPNVWLGVSVENQQWADIRIPALLDIPAAVRFLSCEPLLGRINLSEAIEPNFARHGWKDLSRLHWVIVGGESGRGARPMDPEWAREIRDECGAAGISFLFKQWGEYGQQGWRVDPTHSGAMVRMGKKAAGRSLDGRTWDEYPVGAA